MVDTRKDKPEACQKCQFYAKEGAEYTLPKQKPPTLVVVGESLGWEEAQQGKPFVGQSGKFLDTLLSFFGLSREEDVYITNAIKCFPGAGKYKEKIKKPSIKKCYTLFLKQELEETNPAPVLVLGEPATYAITLHIFNKGRALKELKHRVVQKDGRKYVFMYHPSFYMRRYGEGKAAKEFINQGKEVLRKLFEYQEGELNLDEKPLPFTYAVGEENALKLLRSLLDNEVLIFDIETNGKHFSSPEMEITCIGFCTTDGKIAVTVPTKPVIEELKRFRLVAHNGKFDVNYIRKKYGIRLNLWFDTLLAAYAIDQGRKEYSLESLVYSYCPEAALWRGDTKSKRNMLNLDLPSLYEYNAIDVYATWKLYQTLKPHVKNSFFFWKILLPASDFFADVEFHGAVVDIWHLRYVGSLCSHLRSQVEEKLRNLPEVLRFKEVKKQKYNPRSSQHNLYILQEIKGLLYENPRTKKKVLIPSTDKKVLKQFKDKDEFCKWLLRYRKYSKLESTYAKGIEKKLVNINGIYYGFPSFFLHRTATGRTASGSLSIDSASPISRKKDDVSFNFQNFPRGKLIRGMIVPPPGYIIISFDYSTLEMRIAAGLSNEQHLIKAFKEGLDFHTYMASLTFDIPYEEVSKDKRQMAKTCIGDNAFVLTNNGWKRPYDLDPREDRLCSRNGSWHQFIISENNDVDIYRLKFSNGVEEEYDFNHRLLVFDWETGEERFKNILQITESDFIFTYLHSDSSIALSAVRLEDRVYVGKGRSWAIQIIDGPPEYISSGGIVNHNCSFGLLYGASPLLLVEAFGITEEQAYKIYDKYFSSTPNLKSWINSTIKFIETHGYVETPFGRRRYFQDLKDKSYTRQGPNMVVQSVASDLMLITISLIKKEMQALGWWENEVKFFCVVHDSASFYVKEDPEVIKKSIDIFTECAMLKVAEIPEVKRVLSGCPLLIDFKVGKRWQ